MTIRWQCPYCNKRLTAQDDQGGRRASCPGCHQSLLIPAASSHARRLGRQRMYAFERAYVDYAGNFRGLISWLLRAVAALWHWFWAGPGASLIEWLLRLGVVASGLAAGGLYVKYEIDHGRGFSGGMLFAFIFTALYVAILAWGWKAPIHVIARALSGLVAAALVFCLGVVVASVAALVFLAYLVALFLLTAFSFLVFLPLRFIHWLWLVRRRITYQCPYDNCPEFKLPVHVCSCGHEYRDLQPSFYGIFYHTCRHPDGDVKLPTLDILGRNKLPRRCPNPRCGQPLMFSSLGELQVRPIAVVGGPSTGKSLFLRQGERELMRVLSSRPGARVTIDSEEQTRQFAIDIERLDAGQLLPKTVGDIIAAFGLAVRMPRPNRDRTLFYLYDTPGETFLTVERFGRQQVIRRLSGILLLIDPFSLEALSAHAHALKTAVRASTYPPDRVVATLVEGLSRLAKPGADGKFNIPVAVVLPKADQLPVKEMPFLDGLIPGEQNSAGEALSTRCRDALIRLGGLNCVRILEARFPKTRIRYFAGTALGRSPDLQAGPFQPAGVVEPFLWLLSREKVARPTWATKARVASEPRL